MPPRRSARPAVRRLEQRHRAALRIRALRHDDDAELRAPLVALAQPLRRRGDVERDLGNQDRVGAAGDAGVQRDPAGVAPHHLDDHDALVRLGGRVQPIDRVGREGDRRVEAETVRRADDVVVDRLRHADDRHAQLAELVGDGQRAVAADGDERVEAQLVEHLDARGRSSRACRRRSATSEVERVAAVERAEDRAAEAEDAGDVARREHARAIQLEEAVEAVLDPDASGCRCWRPS